MLRHQQQSDNANLTDSLFCLLLVTLRQVGENVKGMLRMLKRTPDTWTDRYP